MDRWFRNHAALPHFSRGPRATKFLEPGLKSTEKVGSHSGKSQLRKLTAAIAMPMPNTIPANTRLFPPSLKANIKLPTTMATRLRSLAIGLVRDVLELLHRVLPRASARLQQKDCENRVHNWTSCETGIFTARLNTQNQESWTEFFLEGGNAVF